MDEITYTPGRLAKKLGVSKNKLMTHLRATGLIDQCFTTRQGYWQIPYSVAEKISSPQALSLSPTRRPGGQVKSERNRKVNSHESLKGDKERGLSFQARRPLSNLPSSGVLPNYAQIGKTLRQAGVTMADLIKYIEQQMQTEMQKFSPSSGGRGVGPSLHQMEESNERNAFAPGENNSAQRDETQTSETSTSGSAGADIPNSRA